MESAKAAISSFLGGHGKQSTDVDEVVKPAVVSETVKPQRHEETTEAVDREVHQDHYHTTVQPVAHQEVLPEEHKHNVLPQVQKTFEHGSKEQDESRIASELGQFQDTRQVQNTTQSVSAAPTVTGEHVHHHVHETVQPVIHKETIQPEVVHTTIPIHEKHLAPSEHHGISSLPVKTLDEVKSAGLNLGSSHHAQHEYEGHPRPYNADLQLERKPVDINPAAHTGNHDPVETGHFDDKSTSGASGTKGIQSTSGTLGSSSSTGPIHQSSEHGHTAAPILGGVGAAGATRELGHDATHNTTTGTGHTHQSSEHGHTAAPILGGVGAAGAARELGHDATHSTTTGTGTGHTHQSSEHGHSNPLTTATAGAGALGASRGLDHDTTHDSTTIGSSLPSTGRETDRGYQTTTDSKPSFGNTASGLSTGHSDRHGLQDTSSSNTTTTHPTTDTTHSSTAQYGSNTGTHQGPRDESTNLTGGDSKINTDDGKQHESNLSEDPNLVRDPNAESGKWKGTGEPGSHSAVFGLTKTGERFEDTASFRPGDVKPADEEGAKHDAGIGEDTNSSSRGVGTGEVAKQMHDPKVAEPLHEGKAEYNPSSTGKPGAGI